jgi:hypothetical protein
MFVWPSGAESIVDQTHKHTDRISILLYRLDSEPVQWTRKIYNKFWSLEPLTDSLGTRDWPVRLGLDLTHPNILAKPKVIINQVTSRSDVLTLATLGQADFQDTWVTYSFLWATHSFPWPFHSFPWPTHSFPGGRFCCLCVSGQS